MNIDYKHILEGYYDTMGKVKAIDVITNAPYYIEDRPDMKQRIEKIINSSKYLGVYQRGTRNGFKEINKNVDLSHLGITIIKSEKQIKSQNMKEKPQDFIISDLKWKYLTFCIEKSKNLMFVGPSGTGKTQVVYKVAEALDRRVFYFNLGSTQDVRSALIGNTYFKEGTYFEESAFVSAIKTPNAVVLLDEISRANPEAWNILMPVLDVNLRKLRLDEKENSPTIDVANGVSFIATANIGFEYTSTRILDKALADRFNIVEMDVLDKEQEMQLLFMKFPDIQAADNEILCDISDKIKKECSSSNPKISSIISTRTLLEAAEMKINGFSIEDIAQLIIYPQYPNDEGIDSERTFVQQIIQKYVQKGDKKDLFVTKNSKHPDVFDLFKDDDQQ